MRGCSGSTRASNEVLLDLFLGSGYTSATENLLEQSDGFIDCLGSWKKVEKNNLESNDGA